LKETKMNEKCLSFLNLRCGASADKIFREEEELCR